jgi:hypothetical protein
MKYNINYVGRDMSIDEILSKLVGVWIMKIWKLLIENVDKFLILKNQNI